MCHAHSSYHALLISLVISDPISHLPTSYGDFPTITHRLISLCQLICSLEIPKHSLVPFLIDLSVCMTSFLFEISLPSIAHFCMRLIACITSNVTAAIIHHGNSCVAKGVYKQHKQTQTRRPGQLMLGHVPVFI